MAKVSRASASLGPEQPQISARERRVEFGIPGLWIGVRYRTAQYCVCLWFLRNKGDCCSQTCDSHLISPLKAFQVKVNSTIAMSAAQRSKKEVSQIPSRDWLGHLVPSHPTVSTIIYLKSEQSGQWSLQAGKLSTSSRILHISHEGWSFRSHFTL